MDEIKNKFKQDEKVKVRGVIPGSIVGSWTEGVFYFYNEFQPPGREYAVYVPELKDTIFISPEQVFKWEE